MRTSWQCYSVIIARRILIRAWPIGIEDAADPWVALKGLYQPVDHGPNLGLSMVDLNDGSYSITKIYPVSEIPGNKNESRAAATFTCMSPAHKHRLPRCPKPLTLAFRAKREAACGNDAIRTLHAGQHNDLIS